MSLEQYLLFLAGAGVFGLGVFFGALLAELGHHREACYRAQVARADRRDPESKDPPAPQDPDHWWLRSEPPPEWTEESD